ncbi:hypothetical protein K469DRAFT_745650 [Zopfia rhizophila CBS 207.26]|uniref:AA1-like domain-containing protein n=1 Tax=Zopfia rhizophila CBS 207.26 TaxID=1314779 RepID=A0A6A6EN45_9PEZI|nr:hypothetical protein K469DRAFT_745650 [Zopfia rhizophila CBS 207.26]
MRFASILLLGFVPPLVPCTPSPIVQTPSTTTTPTEAKIPTLHVTNFGVFISSNPKVPSHLSFHVQDPRPEWYGEADCVFTTNETYPSVYLGGYWFCPEGKGYVNFAFWLEKDILKIRRPWGDPKDWNHYLIGLPRQETHWNEMATAGTCANVTTTTAGKFYSRTENWNFPINLVIA